MQRAWRSQYILYAGFARGAEEGLRPYTISTLGVLATPDVETH